MASRWLTWSASAQTSFYVTDTATHQNRPLYFRQDDWSTLCAPLLKQLGDSVFEKVPIVSLCLAAVWLLLGADDP